MGPGLEIRCGLPAALPSALNQQLRLPVPYLTFRKRPFETSFCRGTLRMLLSQSLANPPAAFSGVTLRIRTSTQRAFAVPNLSTQIRAFRHGGDPAQCCWPSVSLFKTPSAQRKRA